MPKVEIEGIDDLNKVLDELGRGRGMAAIRQGVFTTGQEVLTESQRNLNAQDQRVTGKLFRSGKVTKVPNEMEVDISYDSNYAYYVEFGRKAGTPPPYAPIIEWVKKKGIADTYSIKTRRRSAKTPKIMKRIVRIAIAIAKGIGKNGTKAKPFLYPALEAKKGNLYANINKSFNEFIDKLRVK